MRMGIEIFKESLDLLDKIEKRISTFSKAERAIVLKRLKEIKETSDQEPEIEPTTEEPQEQEEPTTEAELSPIEIETEQKHRSFLKKILRRK